MKSLLYPANIEPRFYSSVILDKYKCPCQETDATSPEDSDHSQNSSAGDLFVVWPSGVICSSALLCLLSHTSQIRHPHAKIVCGVCYLVTVTRTQQDAFHQILPQFLRPKMHGVRQENPKPPWDLYGKSSIHQCTTPSGFPNNTHQWPLC